MKVVILAGGLGTRISEYTRNIPKPMIKIKGQPILLRIMNHYYKFGLKIFILHRAIKVKLLKIILKTKNSI